MIELREACEVANIGDSEDLTEDESSKAKSRFGTIDMGKTIWVDVEEVRVID